MESRLPFVDEHAIEIDAPRVRVWSALERFVHDALVESDRPVLAWWLGTEPRAGFAVSARVPAERLSLVGRHRFARYSLVFELADAASATTQLRARTYATFPGPHGRIYRALVIGTRLHVVATTRMLRTIRSMSETSVIGR